MEVIPVDGSTEFITVSGEKDFCNDPLSLSSFFVITDHSINTPGGVAEWLKAHDWKSCIR